VLSTHALSLPAWGLLWAGAAGMVWVLAQALREVRSVEWAPAFGWGLGGSFAVGTALWALQLALWHATQEPASAWFAAPPLVGAWALAVGGCGSILLTSRWLPANGVAVALLSALFCGVFVLLGSAMAVPPQWPAMAAVPAGAALATMAAGAWGSLRWLHADPATGTRRLRWQRLGAAGVFALAWLVGQWLALAAALPPLAPPDLSSLAGAMPPDAVDSRLVLLGLGFGGFVLALALVAGRIDSRSGRRTRRLASSLDDANRRLQQLTLHDALTGLPNRAHFEQRLQGLLDDAGPSTPAMAVLFIDIDGFKAVNESFGHAAGDRVLHEVGARLAGLARPQDMAARIGSDEFALLVIAPGSHEAAAAVAQRTLHRLIAPYPLPDGSEIRLSCSVGIALCPAHGPADRLLANADAAMFDVKRSGGSAFGFFAPRMELDASDQLALQTDLRQAIERGELTLSYQPKVDALSGKFTGVEALVRWQHAARGAVGPTELIAVAERFGLIGALGEWVFDEACRQMHAWHGAGLRIPVAVTLSAQQLRQDDLVQRIGRTIARHGVDAALLTFEITETMALQDTQATQRAFAELAREGASLAIDDFGTGHSSLAQLRTLPARQLKIDHSFVADLGQSGDAMAIVDAVIRLAHALGLRVVAEGVETERQRDILQTLDCDEFQGYLFARPMPAERLAQWVAAEEGTTRRFVERRAVPREPVPPAQA
jgi:diguanylate cyclase (GGDEF)-like protein